MECDQQIHAFGFTIETEGNTTEGFTATLYIDKNNDKSINFHTDSKWEQDTEDEYKYTSDAAVPGVSWGKIYLSFHGKMPSA